MSDCKKNKDCGCESSLTTPQPCINIFDCHSDNCPETFDSKCVIYNNDDIICNNEVIVEQGDSVETALQKIVDYNCKTIEYIEVSQIIDVQGNTPLREYGFPGQYNALKFINTSGFTKRYKVHVTYNTAIYGTSQTNTPVGPVNTIYDRIDGAIFKRSGSTYTKLYEVLGYNGFELESGIQFDYYSNNRNVAMFYLVTLNNNEEVNLQFKNEGADAQSELVKAQMLIEEV